MRTALEMRLGNELNQVWDLFIDAKEEIQALQKKDTEARRLLLASIQAGMSHDDTAIESVASACQAFLSKGLEEE